MKSDGGGGYAIISAPTLLSNLFGIILMPLDGASGEFGSIPFVGLNFLF